MGTALLLSSCGDGALPERTLRRDDCLRDVDLAALPEAMRQCNQVVARYPQDPLPRNERSLLLALSGDDQGACRDIAVAHGLVQRAKAGSLDPLLVSEINVRRSSCQEKR
jgi:hypothetical protein